MSETATKKVCVALPVASVEQLHGLSATSNCTQAEILAIGLQLFTLGQQAQANGGRLTIVNRDGQVQTEITLPYSQPFQVRQADGKPC
jgi:hypothetical protein